MRGWRALTSDWERPILPEAVAPRVPSLPPPRREGLVTDEVRKVVSDLDVIALTAQKEIRRVLTEKGLNKKQQVSLINRMRLARR